MTWRALVRCGIGLLVLLPFPSVAYAERSSGGKGGAVGVRTGWPCAKCITIAPASATDVEDSKPTPVLVALHGDNGSATQMVSSWKDAAERAGVILVSLTCPVEKGCNQASWWKWFQTPLHDPTWLGQQLDAVEAAYAVDLDRVYATGFSGGSSYLGYYVPENSARFSAVAYVSGGYPYAKECPSCKVPTTFLIGGSDSMIETYVRPLWRYFEACGGHEMHWDQMPNVGHVQMLTRLRDGRAASLLSWMLEHPRSCGSLAAAASASAVLPVMPFASCSSPSVPQLSPLTAEAPLRPPAAPPSVHGGCGCAPRETTSSLSLLGGALALVALGASTMRRR